MSEDAEPEILTERYRRQGMFWRMFSLFQFPVSICLTFYFIFRYLGADTIVHVPEPKTMEDGTLQKIPEKEYINVAQNIVSLIGTYQPLTAREQFETARDFFSDQAINSFDETQTNGELNTAEESDISQILTVEHTSIVRQPIGAKVCIRGVRHRIVLRTVLPQQEVTYCLVLVPDEPFEGNPFGLMATEFTQRLGPTQQANVARKAAPRFEKGPQKAKKPVKRGRRPKTT